MIEYADDDAGLIAKTAVIESLSADGYCVRITRADGVVIPINCDSAAAAALLIREMKPPERFISIPEGPARDAMLFALGEDGQAAPPRTLH